MSNSSNFIDINVRPRRTRGVRCSKKSILYSDYNAEEDSKNVNLGQRSISLTALSHAGPGSTSTAATTTSGPTLEPRMAQLETLEAKMASIEVSLCTSPRRKNGKKTGSGQLGLITKASALGGSPAMNILASLRSNTLIDTCRELEMLRNALKDKENTIQNLQGQMNCCGRLTSPQPLDSTERRVAELRLQTLKQEEESKKSSIKRINLALEQIDESESNIDVRIRQAELEYELGREELGLLGVREEMRSLQARLDAKPMPTLYSCVSTSGRSSLYCVQLEYDPKSPRFGAGNAEDKIGLFVLWAAEDSGLQKGDRILEINGKITLTTNKEEMNRLLTVCPSRTEIVVNRPWVAPPSAEDFLRRENLRLTHRISYLEDQVAELLIQKEKSSVLMKQPKYEKMDVFQKGPQVTVLQNSDPSKCENHLTTVTISSAQKIIVNSTDQTDGEKYKTYNGNDADIASVQHGTKGKVSRVCQMTEEPGEKYKTEDGQVLQSKIHNGGDKVKIFSKKYEKDEFSSALSKSKCKSEDGEKHAVKNGKIIKNCIQMESDYSLSDMERPIKRGNGYYNRVVDYNSETSSPQYRPRDKNVKMLDLDGREDSRIRYKTDNQSGDPTDTTKPAPPKKPIRLSIHRATSLQNVETGYSLHNAIRKIKRSHKGEAPQPPAAPESKTNGVEESHSVNGDVLSPRTSSRAESWVNHSDSSQSPFRWPGQHHRNRSKSGEKWC